MALMSVCLAKRGSQGSLIFYLYIYINKISENPAWLNTHSSEPYNCSSNTQNLRFKTKFRLNIYIYTVKRPLKNRQNKDLNDKW